MRYLFVLIVLMSFHSEAATTTCVNTAGAVLGKPFSLASVPLTINASVADYTILYTYASTMAGVSSSSCAGNTDGVELATTLIDLPPGAPLTHDGNIIYPTSIPGLGLSFTSLTGNNVGAVIKPYPEIVRRGFWISNGWGLWFNMILWKIPGDLPSGVLSFTGPTIVQGYVQNTAGNTFVNTSMTYGISPTFFTVTSRILTGSVTLVNGTCELMGGDKQVQLGRLDNEPIINSSAWTDASFTLKCPKAFGYGGTNSNYFEGSSAGTNTANTVKNGTVTVNIIPRTEIITRNHRGATIGGTIALDGTGAKGYGVQIAWGDFAQQSQDAPAKPVMFNTPVPASQLNSAYGSGPYAFGSDMPNSEIKMAARFVKTGPVQPGPAKAAIEVVATYN